MNLENYFIRQFSSRYVGDDGAIVGKWVYSKDAFYEDVHYRRKWLTCTEIARKAMLVNISDAIAMNATPKYALLSVAMPDNMTKKEAQELAKGFEKTAKEYNIEIIGGDTICNTKLDITVTLVSHVKKPLRRNGLKSGDYIAYTGEIGKSAKELRKLLYFNSVSKYSKFKHLKLRRAFIEKAAAQLSCGMDISDGLMSDLEKLAHINSLGFRFFEKISKQKGCSGEEYEMLVGFDKRRKKAIIRKAKQTRTPLHIIGVAARNKYTNRCKGHHFG